jgi:CHASE3 domain sensor protein
LALSAVAWIGLAASAFFLVISDQQLSERRGSVRTFDAHAHDATTALADARAGQQAYVAAGQDVGLWLRKVGAAIGAANGAVNRLRETATNDESRAALVESTSSIAELETLDKRAREYVRSGQILMAGDVVFTEGGTLAATAARQVDAAKLAEREALDSYERSTRRREFYAAGSAIGFAAVALLILALSPVSGSRAEVQAPSTDEVTDATSSDNLALREAVLPTFPNVELPRGSAPALRAAAELCTEFGRVNEIADVTRLLKRTADLIDASGLIVWLGDNAGGDLKPVLTHGYSDQVLARMSSVPRSSDNAAAAAYRSGELQIVLCRPGTSQGAIATPLLSGEGCIGALTIEVRDGGETSDSVQALAQIFAAQLAGPLAASAVVDPAVRARSASA